MGTRTEAEDEGSDEYTDLRTPMGRRGLPFEVAAAVAFLLSDDASCECSSSLGVFLRGLSHAGCCARHHGRGAACRRRVDRDMTRGWVRP